jgi:hypothetical protein
MQLFAILAYYVPSTFQFTYIVFGIRKPIKSSVGLYTGQPFSFVYLNLLKPSGNFTYHQF